MTDLTAGTGRQWLRHPALSIGGIAALALLLLGFVSIVWTPYSTETLNVGATLQDPSGAHWFGTDHLGRDMLSMMMRGLLTSFVVSAVAVVIGVIVGVPLGLAAAASGGIADWAILRVTDFIAAFPALIAAILLTALFGPGAVNIMLAVGIFNIAIFARTTRDGASALSAPDYVGAARLAGMGPIDIARRHIFPALGPLIVVTAVAQLALGILAEAGLSYVGLGSQPPGTSLGLLLRDAQPYAALKPALALTPGLLIVLVVIALNLTAEGLRAQLDSLLTRAGGSNGAA